MTKTLEELFLDRILYIGNETPNLGQNNPLPKFILKGTPQELINEIKNLNQ